jgi:hypothetical protein
MFNCEEGASRGPPVDRESRISAARVEHDERIFIGKQVALQCFEAACLSCNARTVRPAHCRTNERELAEVDEEISRGRAAIPLRAPAKPISSTIDACRWYDSPIDACSGLVMRNTAVYQTAIHPSVTGQLERTNSGERTAIIQEWGWWDTTSLEHKDCVSVRQLEAGERVEYARLPANARAVLLKPIRPNNFEVAEVLCEILS